MTIELTEKSVDNAIAYFKELERILTEQEYARKIAEVGFETLKSVMGNSLTYSLDKTGDGYTISANGEAVCFLEFGTGFLTDEGSPYANAVSIEVKPGSWSKDHAQTFQNWKGAASDYPFNRAPKRGFYLAYRAMERDAKRIVKECMTLK